MKAQITLALFALICYALISNIVYKSYKNAVIKMNERQEGYFLIEVK